MEEREVRGMRIVLSCVLPRLSSNRKRVVTPCGNTVVVVVVVVAVAVVVVVVVVIVAVVIVLLLLILH